MAAVQIIGANFDASKVTPEADGTWRLPAWLSIRCPTAERSAQQSAATVRTGYAANAARAFSRDGSSWGLLVEPAATNLVDDQDLSSWTPTGTPVLSGATTPAGTTETVEVGDDDAGSIERVSLTTTNSVLANTAYALSTWTWKIDNASTEASLQVIRGGGFFPGLGISDFGLDAGWTYETDAATNDGTPGTLELRLLPAATAAADLASARWWGLQLEQRAYPTSFIGADNATFLRAADVLRAIGEIVAPGGFPELTLTYRPHYSNSEATTDHNLIYFDDDNRCFFRASDDRVELVIGGATVALLGPITFSRHQELTIALSLTSTGRAFSVSGATAGDGTATGDALDPLEVPTYVYILGDADGAEHGADVRALLVGSALTFCDITDERALVQMNREPAPDGSKFRDMMCLFAEPFADFFDACAAVKYGLGLDTAEGAQLDLIGTIVGLPREGFEDDRYRVFLEIQVELLLSAAREDREWTGTGENILRITRKFVGDAAPPIILLNQPPYSYELSAVLADLDEAGFLVRFLSTANYAAVRGLALVNLDSANDSVMGSEAVSVTNAGIMGSASVSVTDAMVMGTVLETS